MKDPLHRKLTCYEVLGIPETADRNMVEGAFRKAISLGQNIAEVREARNTLSKPVERGLVDIFLYNDVYLQQIVPRTDKDISQLIGRRGDISQAWSNLQKKVFPHFPSAHSLAVLWHAWAVYKEEENLAQRTHSPFDKAEALSDGVLPDMMWSNAIALWTFLINSKEFWKDWIGTRESTRAYLALDQDASELSQRLEAYFAGLFHNYTEKYRQAGDDSSVKRLHNLELLFSTEMKTARSLFKAGVKLPRGEQWITIACGRLMLEQAGILESIRGVLATFIERNPQDLRLKELAANLSPFAGIAVLVENRRFEEAIETIASLPESQRKEGEVLMLLGRSYLELGRQQFSLKQYEEALGTWQAGLKAGALNAEIQKAIVEESKTKAASLQNSDPETAIKILKGALRVVSSKELQSTLAEILTTRGIQIINEAQNSIQTQKKVTKQVEAELEKGVSYLREAKDLGSKRGAENYENVKGIVEQAKSGLLGLSQETAALIQRANEAAQAGSWDQAIELMRRARDGAAAEEKPALAKMLAQFLNARGVQFLDGATYAVNRAYEGRQAASQMMVNAYLSGEEDWLGLLTGSGKGKSRKKKKRNTKSTVALILGAALFIAFIAFGGKLFGKENVKGIFNVIGLIFILGPALLWLISKIGDFLTSTTKMITPTYGYSGPAPKCSYPRCAGDAAYAYNLPDRGEVKLCSTHAEGLRKIIEAPPALDTQTKRKIRQAKTDFEEASGLDPANATVRQNLQQAESVISQLGISWSGDFSFGDLP
jgi:hypothetical protein